MGDRANVHITSEGNSVYLYTHWAGTELPKTLQDALRIGDRWTDEQYLARIIFCEMVKDQRGTSGYGISSYCGDGDTRVLEVNVDKQTVSYGEKVWTFAEYLTIDTVKDVWRYGQ